MRKLPFGIYKLTVLKCAGLSVAALVSYASLYRVA